MDAASRDPEFEKEVPRNADRSSSPLDRERSSATLRRNRARRFLSDGRVGLPRHDVTLFASGDSRTSARLRPICEIALRQDPACADPLPYHLLLIEKVLQAANQFDVIHFHTDYLHFPAFRRQPTPTLTTLHGRLDLPDPPTLYQEFSDVPVVSISDHQRIPLPWLNWRGTIYHGLPRDLLGPGSGSGGYTAFLGRICPEKRPDRAIRIAREAGIPLKVAAKVDRVDETYFDQVIRPMLDDPLIEFVGEISEDEKSRFLGQAQALLFPIDWPEPFGLAMIEAMACGTPVIAYLAGSVPEVVDDGVTGFVVENCRQAVYALSRLGGLDRGQIRRVFERRFSVERMVDDYLAIYHSLAHREPASLHVA